MSSIQYTDLDPRNHAFRLLTLLGRSVPPRAGTSSQEDPIYCTLQPRSLNEGLKYYALSYTWGSEEPSATIFIDNQPTVVRENLKNALQHIQLEGKSTTIWVDAICINQRNDSEKSRQVQMMSEIYKRAVAVLVWLGLMKDDSDTAMDRLENIGRKAIQAGMQEFRASDVGTWLNPTSDDRLSRLHVTLEKLAEDEGLGIFHPSFVQLSEREYWSRTWVAQEMALPSQVVLLCGRKSMSLITFMAASNFCAFARWRLARRYSLSDRRDPVIGPQIMSLSARAPSAAPNILIGIRRRYQLETGEQESLQSLLKKTCYRKPVHWPLKATDPRDKIYGILALASDAVDLGVQPDYAKTTVEVYRHVTRALIDAGQTIALTWNQQAKQVKGLPSWVPDFSAPIREPCGENNLTGSLFYASGTGDFARIFLQSSSAENILGLSGTTIDTIKQLGSAWEPQVDEAFDRAAAQRLLQETEHFCEISALFTTRAQIEDAKMRTPCADQQCYDPADRQRVSSLSTLREDYELLRLPESSTSEDVPSRRYIVSMGFQHDRRPFLSVNGHVGLAPTHARPGDYICLLFGATVPFILRPVEDEKFELVGEAYVHGAMDGEWLETSPATENFNLC